MSYWFKNTTKTDWWYYEEIQLRNWIRGVDCKEGCTTYNVEYTRLFNESINNLERTRCILMICKVMIDELVRIEQDKRAKRVYRNSKNYFRIMIESVTREIKLGYAIKSALKKYKVQEPKEKRMMYENNKKFCNRSKYLEEVVIPSNIDLLPLRCYCKHLELQNSSLVDDLESKVSEEAFDSVMQGDIENEELSKYVADIFAYVEECKYKQHYEYITQYLLKRGFRDGTRARVELTEITPIEVKLKKKAEDSLDALCARQKLLIDTINSKNESKNIPVNYYERMFGAAKKNECCWLILVAPVEGRQTGKVKYICSSRGDYDIALSRMEIFVDKTVAANALKEFKKNEPYAEYKCIEFKRKVIEV